MKLYQLLPLLTVLILSSCEDVIDINPPLGKDALVVEGWLTDRPQDHYVKLYLTRPLTDQSGFTPVSHARVELKDNEGHSEILIESNPGTYAIKTLKSVAGRSYTLTIESSKGNYKALAVTPRLSMLPDSLAFKFEKKSAIYEKEGHYPRFYGQELAGKGDYIQVKLFKNGTFLNKAGDFNIFSDEFVDGNYIDNAELAVNDPFQKNDVLKAEVWSLSEDAYNFWIDIQVQLQNGQIFATPFANTRSNLQKTSNEAMDVVGYFGSSLVKTVERKVE